MPDRHSSALTEVRTVHSRAGTATYTLQIQIEGLKRRMARGTPLSHTEPHTLEELEDILEALEQVVRITDKFAKEKNKVYP